MLLFSTWDKLEENVPSLLYRKIVAEVLGSPLPEAYTLPFSMNDHTELEVLLRTAGFSKISIEHVQKISSAKTAKEIAVALATGGSIYNDIVALDPSLVDSIVDKFEKQLVEKYGASAVEVPMQAVISQAWK